MRRAALTVGVIVISLTGETSLVAQTSAGKQQPAVTTTRPQAGRNSKPPTPARDKQAEAVLSARLWGVLRAIADDAARWEDAAVSARTQAQIADLVWQTDPVGAHVYLVNAWKATERIEEPKRERSQFRNESRRTDGRREVLSVARKRARPNSPTSG